MLIVQFIMLNVFILVILQEFEKNYVNPDNPMKNFKDDVTSFKKAWIEFAAIHQGLKVKSNKLIDLFATLPEPLGTHPG